ncbi:unnamed protein product, partial [Effrenium voratum]
EFCQHCSKADAEHGPLSDGLLPFAVCQAVTTAVWTAARKQAESAHRDVALRFPLSLGSEASQTQPDELCVEAAGASLEAAEEVVSLALSTLTTALKESGWEAERLGAAVCAALRRSRPRPIGGSACPAEDVLVARVRTMSLCAVAYWRQVSQDLGKAAASLARYLEQHRRLYWRRPPYRGVNLGGWLLLEPGPSHELFQLHGTNANRCEWSLLRTMRERLGAEKTTEVLHAHRSTFLTEEDFRQIRARGFNAVRIPFGYWVVCGASGGDPYVGPGLEFLDRALTWCRQLGLQALLDLHGAPGGESAEAPCGRESSKWRWQLWRFDESLEALRILAQRYKGHPAVTGISVCNEPSEKVPAEVLCKFYDQAVRAIRTAGMPPEEVSIVLPIYRTERLDEIWRVWSKTFDGFARHANVAFDLHLYHCFGAWWHRQGLGSHLRMAKRDRKILRRVPAVVGEWSLALPQKAVAQADHEDQAYKAFASAQLQAYSHASHGWFFWNWCDSPEHHPGWDARTCLKRQWLELE